MLLALALTVLSSNPQTMAGGRGGVLVPAPFFNLLTSNPGTECDGSALTSTEGTSISFGRALAAYCTRVADGVLVSVASGSPRVNNNGLLIEGSRVNFVEQSQTLGTTWSATNVTVTADNANGPDGTATADTLESTSNGGYIESDVFVPNQTTLTLSLWVREVTTSDVDVVVRDTTAGADRTTCDLTTSGTLTRISCASSGLTGANNHVIRIYPGGTASTGTIEAWGVQVEAPLSTFRTSYVPTTTAAVTRPNDVATWANGTDISTAGCISATVTFDSATISSNAGIISNGVERMLGYASATSMHINDGSNSVSAAVSSVLGRTINIKTWWSASSGQMGITADGVSASGAFDGSFSSTATMRIGATAAGSGYSYTTIDNIKVGAHPNSCD